MSDDKIQRIARLAGLPIPSKEDHQRAVDAMAPYLAAFQQAVNEQVAADFRVPEDYATCVLTTPDGLTVTLQVTDVQPHARGQVLLTFVGEPRVERKVK